MESQPFLKLQSLVVLVGKWLPFSQVGGIPMSAREPHWWHINGVPNNVTRKQLPQTKCFYIISFQGLCTHNEWPYPEFQFTATDFISMAAKSSDLVDKMSEANLQADGQMEKPAQRAVDLWEMEEEDGSPLHSLTWSPVQRLLLGHLNMKHCLENPSDFNKWIGGCAPTLSFVDASGDRRYDARGQSWTDWSSSIWSR